MADLKISALPASTTPLAGTEVLPIVQSSTTKQVSVANLTAGRAVSGTTFTGTNTIGFQMTAAADQDVRFALPGVIDWRVRGNYSTANLDFVCVSNSTPLTLRFGGDVAVNTGNLVIGTSGKGIDFSANTPAAGMTSELLNWYEEGTWTPTSTTLTIVGSPTYDGHYVRQGRIVYVTLRIQATSITSSGAIISLGFPFVSASILTTVPVSNVANNASLGAGFITVSGGNTIIYLPNFTALTDVMFTGFYFV
jgi:hypothetical protein